jgi:hypothetical protein
MASSQVFVHVESHEMVDVEDNKSPDHLYPDAESEQEHQRTMWEGGDIKNKSVESVA